MKIKSIINTILLAGLAIGTIIFICGFVSHMCLTKTYVINSENVMAYSDDYINCSTDKANITYRFKEGEKVIGSADSVFNRDVEWVKIYQYGYVDTTYLDECKLWIQIDDSNINTSIFFLNDPRIICALLTIVLIILLWCTNKKE